MAVAVLRPLNAQNQHRLYTLFLEGYHKMLIVFNFCKSYYIAGDKYLLFFIYFPSLLLVEEYTLENFSIYYFFNNFKSLKHLSTIMHVQ